MLCFPILRGKKILLQEMVRAWRPRAALSLRPWDQWTVQKIYMSKKTL